MRILSTILLSFVLVAVGAGPVAAEMHGGEHASLEQLVVEMADTPDEHQALARYYRGKAEHMRTMAAEHNSMGSVYTGTKMMQRKRMQEHCSDLAASFTQAAKDYDALADQHEEAAKQ